jgi:hypothetical protein
MGVKIRMMRRNNSAKAVPALSLHLMLTGDKAPVHLSPYPFRGFCLAPFPSPLRIAGGVGQEDDSEDGGRDAERGTGKPPPGPGHATATVAWWPSKWMDQNKAA